MQSHVELRFFGIFRATEEGQRLDISLGKKVAFLAYLAANTIPQYRDHLAKLLWPHSLPDAAAKNLRNMLWEIRKTFQGDVILDQGDALTLAPDRVWTDIARLQHLTQELGQADSRYLASIQSELIDLYRGDFLEGISFNDLPDFEIWLTIERESHNQRYLNALAQLVEAHRQSSNWPAVITVANVALSVDNLLEPMYSATMEAYAYQGQRANALRQYDILRDLLSRELDDVPLAETQQLYQAVLEGKIQAQPTEKPQRKSTLFISTNTILQAQHIAKNYRQHHQSSEKGFMMVGRAEPYSQLLEAAYEAQLGRLQLVTVIGEMGSGKTRLANEFIRLMRQQGCYILQGAAVGTQQAYYPLLQALQPHLLQQSPPDWIAAMATLGRELANQHGFVVLFIDDWQWSDLDSHQALLELSDRWLTEGTPIMLLLNVQQIALIQDEFRQQLIQLEQNMPAQRLYLDNLVLQDTQILLQSLLPEQDDDLTAVAYLNSAIFAATKGLPFYYMTLLKHLLGDSPLKSQLAPEMVHAVQNFVPDSISERVRLRLSGLSEAGRMLLTGLSIMRSETTIEQLSLLVNLPPEFVQGSLNELIDHNFIQALEPSAFQLVYPIEQRVVYQEVRQTRRQILHRRALEILEAEGAAHNILQYHATRI